MKTKTKVLILAAIAVIAIMAMIVPGLTGPSEFQVTNQPLVAFEETEKSGKPIFLEFYAKW